MSDPENALPFKPDIPFWVVSLAFIGILFWAIWPISHFSPPPGPPPARACINNLRQSDAAAQEFALENHLTNGAPIHFPNDLTPYIKLNAQGQIPGCPQGGVYSISKVGDRPKCSLGTTVTPAHVLP